MFLVDLPQGSYSSFLGPPINSSCSFERHVGCAYMRHICLVCSLNSLNIAWRRLPSNSRIQLLPVSEHTGILTLMHEKSGFEFYGLHGSLQCETWRRNTLVSVTYILLVQVCFIGYSHLGFYYQCSHRYTSQQQFDVYPEYLVLTTVLPNFFTIEVSVAMQYPRSGPQHHAKVVRAFF